jgi:hypothetical protein
MQLQALLREYPLDTGRLGTLCRPLCGIEEHLRQKGPSEVILPDPCLEGKEQKALTQYHMVLVDESLTHIIGRCA